LATSSSPSPSRTDGRRLRVALVTSGRFHVADLARELHALGHDVTLYSGVPPARLRALGLPPERTRWLGPAAAAALLANRRAMRTPLRELAAQVSGQIVDRAAARLLAPCDVVLGMSGLCLETLETARRRFGALTIVERSSQHILAQRDLLRAIAPDGRVPRTLQVPRWTIARELEEYAFADRISVPSQHVVESFLARGVARDRLLVNPFGTDISRFRPTPAPAAGTRRIIMAGTWSRQKGADVLIDAWRRLDAAQPTELVHCGAVLDVPLPRAPRFTSLGFLSQDALWRAYGESSVFALPSRQEGLAVVQIQALASGLPLVCSTRTGGADLRPYLPDPDAIRVVPPDDPDALAAALGAALDAPAPPPGAPRDLLGPARHALSWRGYAERWEAHLYALLGDAPAAPR